MCIITIARGTFSGGKELAERLSERLGYRSLSREVIGEAAESYGVSANALVAAMERAPSLMDRFKRDRDQYVAYVRAILCQHAQEDGNLVYHGLAGHFLLAGVSHVIRVRVVADLHYRIEAAMARMNMTAHQAEAHIRKVDKARMKWTRFLYGETWSDPSSYDAVLNLAHMGIPGAVEVVARMDQLEEFQPTDESRTALANLTVASLVSAALFKDDRTADADLHVEASSGVVTVSGVVRRSDMVGAVAEVAGSVEGVRQVTNNVAFTSGYPL